LFNDEVREAPLGITIHSRLPSIHAKSYDVDHLDGLGQETFFETGSPTDKTTNCDGIFVIVHFGVQTIGFQVLRQIICDEAASYSNQ
jgi:hypothetical protein